MFKSAWLLSGISAFGLLAGTAMAQDAKPMPAAAAPAPAPVMSSPVVIGGCGSCGSSCCTSGCTTGCFDSGCEDDCKHGHVLADVTFMILTPRWNSNPAIFAFNFSPTNVNDEAVGVKNFGTADQFVPKIELGYVGASGLGARISWWGFATSKTESETTAAGADTTLASADPLGLSAQRPFFDSGSFAASERLQMDIWDLEALYEIESGNASLLVSGGLRFAHIAENYNAAELFGPEDGGGPNHFLESGHNFNGAGLTGALQGRYGRRLYVTGTIRGSLLFGEGGQSALTGDAQDTPPARNYAESNYSMVVPAIEGELGIGFKGSDSRRLVPFFEMGLNAQAWFDVGNPALSTVGVNSGGSFLPGPSFSGTTSDATLGLIGVYIRGGLTF